MLLQGALGLNFGDLDLGVQLRVRLYVPALFLLGPSAKLSEFGGALGNMVQLPSPSQ